MRAGRLRLDPRAPRPPAAQAIPFHESVRPMKKIDLSVESREETGTGPNYRLRQAGRLPGVIYGAGGTTEKISLDYHDFTLLMKRADAEKSLLNVKAPGVAETAAVIREIQRDPVTRRFLHVDLYRVRLDVPAVFEIAVHHAGTPQGVREGGILETHLRFVTVKCLPEQMPGAITIDIAGLKLNSSFHASELHLADGVTLMTHGEETLFTVLAPRGEAVADPEAATQPEVIGKKKPDEKAAAKPAGKK